jgi:hypothetical protein
MTKQPHPLDRTAAQTVLLELSPDGFGRSGDTSGELITRFLGDWQASDSTDMFAYAQGWLAANPIGGEAHVTTPAELGHTDDPDMPWEEFMAGLHEQAAQTPAAGDGPQLRPSDAQWWQQQPGESAAAWEARTHRTAADIRAAIQARLTFLDGREEEPPEPGRDLGPEINDRGGAGGFDPRADEAARLEEEHYGLEPGR